MIVTPENIPLRLELAGLGLRFGALLIDLFLMMTAAIVLLITLSLLSLTLKDNGLVGALAAITFFLLTFGYFIFFETFWNGQTPGKRALGLRVLRDGGYPITFTAAAARGLVRIADFLPVPIPFLPGALSVFFHPEYKRLGDIVAGTVVIKEPSADSERTRTLYAKVQAHFSRYDLGPQAANPVTELTPAELAMLRRFAFRRFEMNPDDAERLAYRLTAPLVARLRLSFQPNTAPRYADVVSTIVALADAAEAAEQ
jgi:uncharacterized RDD family membrane protein YckC